MGWQLGQFLGHAIVQLIVILERKKKTQARRPGPKSQACTERLVQPKTRITARGLAQEWPKASSDLVFLQLIQAQKQA